MHTTNYNKLGLTIMLSLTALLLSVYAVLDNITILYEHIDMSLFTQNQLGVLVLFGAVASFVLALLINYSMFHLIYLIARIKVSKSSIYLDTILAFTLTTIITILFQKNAHFQRYAHLYRTATLSLLFALCAFLRNRRRNIPHLRQRIILFLGIFCFWVVEFGLVSLLSEYLLP